MSITAANGALGSSDDQVVEEVLKEIRKHDGADLEQLKACDPGTIRRYLRARSCNVQKAARMLIATLKWRKEFNIDTLCISEFSDRELHSGRMYIAGNDPSGKSILVTRKRSDSFKSGEYSAYLRYLVFTLETAGRAMKQPQEKWVWLMDMRGYSRANSPPLSVSLATLRILADHYPERLHRCFFIDAPGIFNFLFNALWPFIDPITREKIVFVNTKDYEREVAAVMESAGDEAKREAALAAAAQKEKPDAFCNYLRWYCAAYDHQTYLNLLKGVGWP